MAKAGLVDDLEKLKALKVLNQKVNILPRWALKKKMM